jgi:uncharacterized protein (TIGR03435 family)
MFRSVTGLLLLAPLAVFAQAQAFDVASIRAGQPGREVIEAVPGSLTMRNARLVTCIKWAYDVQEYQVSGPGWLSEVRFDISAKAATPVKQPELRHMLQALLADRFKLTVHRQPKEMQVLILTVGKNGHKLKPVETDAEPDFKTGKMNLTGQGATLAQLTDFISGQLRTPILDQTGLTGRFNYFLDIEPYLTDENRRGGPNGGPPPDAPGIVSQALQAQLGLRLDGKKAPVDMVMVDRVERTPTEN